MERLAASKASHSTEGSGTCRVCPLDWDPLHLFFTQLDFEFCNTVLVNWRNMSRLNKWFEHETFSSSCCILFLLIDKLFYLVGLNAEIHVLGWAWVSLLLCDNLWLDHFLFAIWLIIIFIFLLLWLLNRSFLLRWYWQWLFADFRMFELVIQLNLFQFFKPYRKCGLLCFEATCPLFGFS